jgi:DNA-binding transcriptional LysR family regulator
VRRVDLSAQKLWQEDYLLAVPAGHRLAASDRPVALGEAATEPLVVVDGVASTAALLAACEERGARPRIVVEADNLEAVRRMVERGVGIALLPRIMAEAAVSDRMRTVEVARGGLRRQVALVHRGEAYLTGAARALRSTLIAVLARRKAPARTLR